MSKKLIISVFALTSLFAACGVAFAESNSGPTVKSMHEDFKSDDFKSISTKLPHGVGQKGLVITPSGEVMVGSAKVISIAMPGNCVGGAEVCTQFTSYNLNAMGITLSIRANNDTKISGNATSTNISVGDMVSVKGSIDQSSGVITAKSIRNESKVSTQISEIEARIRALQEQLKKLLQEAKNLTN